MNQAGIPLCAELDSDGLGPLPGKSNPAPAQGVRTVSPWILLAIVWVLSALYLASDLRRGWMPHDDGVLAQSAERVLFGQLPHRDFDEIYTGALSYLNADAFRLFGTNLASMRYMLYLFFLAWVPSVYYIALRFTTPLIAAAFTFLAVAWSVPNYPTAMPSWYNLFFATLGVAALFQYIERHDRVWLLVAGACGGLSFLFKLSGMYFVAGAVLFLLSQKKEDGVEATKLERWLCIAFAASCVAIFEISVLSLLRKVFYLGSFLYFLLPVLIVGAAVIWQRIRSKTLEHQFRMTVENLLWFGAGVAIPIALFLIPYMKGGAVGDFIYGVFILPSKRLHFTVRTQSLPRFLTGTVTDVLCVLLIFAGPRRLRTAAGWVMAAAAAIVALVAKNHPQVYDAAWVPIWNALPVAVALGVSILLAATGRIRLERRQEISLLLSVTACCSLIQFPYSAPIYFCYVAPLLILSIVAIGTSVEHPPRLVLSALFFVCLLYTVLDMTPKFLSNHSGIQGAGSNPEFALPRSGGLQLYGDAVREDTEMVKILRQHATGTYIYATPDCPQVYFLSGFRNPTRTLFDFMDDPQGRTQRILSAIRSHNVSAIVINRAANFSGPVPHDLKEALDSEFPEQTNTENFEIRWKP